MTDEQRKRVHDITYSTDDREELAERIVALEELCANMCDLLPHADWPSNECDDRASACIDQAIELGVPR